MKTRDKHLIASQNEVESALAALGLALRSLNSEKKGEKMVATCQHLTDTGAILAEHFFRLSVTRRVFILPTLPDKGVTAVTEATQPSLLLFGEDLGTKLRAAKVIVKTGQEFLAPKPRKPLQQSKQQGNYKRPPYNQGHQSGKKKGDPGKKSKENHSPYHKTHTQQGSQHRQDNHQEHRSTASN